MSADVRERFAWLVGGVRRDAVERRSPGVMLFATYLSWSAVSLIGLTGSFFLWRRIGATPQPLGFLGLASTAILLTVAVGSLRWVTKPAGIAGPLQVERFGTGYGNGDTRPSLHLVVWLTLPTLALLIWGIAISLPGSSVAGLSCLWALVVLEESWWWQPAIHWIASSRRQPAAAHASSGDIQPDPPQSALPSASPQPSPPESSSATALVIDQLNHDEQELEEEPELEEFFPLAATQQITRCRTPEGGETVEGLLRAEFRSGQRMQFLHVSFCPPLSAAPTVTCYAIDGPTCGLKMAESKPYGARFELKLDAAASDTCTVVVQFTANTNSTTKD